MAKRVAIQYADHWENNPKRTNTDISFSEIAEGRYATFPFNVWIGRAFLDCMPLCARYNRNPLNMRLSLNEKQLLTDHIISPSIFSFVQHVLFRIAAGITNDSKFEKSDYATRI